MPRRLVHGRDGRTDIFQPRRLHQLRPGLGPGLGITGQAHQAFGLLVEGRRGGAQRLMLGGVDVGRVAGVQGRDRLIEGRLARPIILKGLVSPRRHIGAHGVLFLDRRGQRPIRGVADLSRGPFGRIGLLKRHQAEQDHQGGCAARAHHGPKGDHELDGYR